MLGLHPARLQDALRRNPKTREISAWWLRRRIFGVFGKGEAYEQIINTIGDQSVSPLKRAYAANALGEFLEGAASRRCPTRS